MDRQDRKERFIDLITAYQGRLYGYIFALVHNRNDADDLFQATSLVLWKKFDLFEPGTDFFRWARRTAHFEVRNHLKRRQLPQAAFRLELLEALGETDDASVSQQPEAYQEALKSCMNKCPRQDQKYLELFYGEEKSAQQIADEVGRSRQSVSNTLRRIRKVLFDCITRRVASEAHA